MTVSLAPPALVVQQLFARNPSGVDRPLAPLLIGPLAQTVRYGQADEKEDGFLGDYDDDPGLVDGKAQTAFVYPNLELGNVIDQDTVKVFVENGLWQYFQSTDSGIRAKSLTKVRVPTDVFRKKNGFDNTVLDGGVQVGDLIRIKGQDDNTDDFTHSTYVIDVVGDTVSSSVGAASAASNNQGVVTEGSSVTADADNSDALSIAVDPSGYDGRLAGIAEETYTVEVIEGGIPTTAKVKVTSASGTDNQSSVTTVALNNPLSIGTRGATVTFTADQGSSFTLGDSWDVTVRAGYAIPSLALAGTYTGSRDRTYVVEVTEGGDLGSAKVLISSQDGTDSLPEKVATVAPFALGSYGITLEYTAADGLFTGDSWSVPATAESEGALRTLVLASTLPSNVPLDQDTGLEVELFRRISRELPVQTTTSGGSTYTVEASQVLIAGGIEVYDPDITLSGSAIATKLMSPGDFTGASKLYVEYRSWYPSSSDLMSISAREDLGTALSGPTDDWNPLKKAVQVCRLGAGGETIYAINTGDPDLLSNWEDVLDIVSRSNSVYGYVPLSLDADVQAAVLSAVNEANDERENSYRVAWFGSSNFVSGSVLDATSTSDEEVALAVVEDDSAASGTQYTQVRLTSGNADLLELGIRAGDEVHYNFSVDAWGNETKTTRLISSVRSADTLIISEELGEQAIPLKIEVHRTYNRAELRQKYSAEAGQWSSDLVRYVLAPSAVVGTVTLPSYYVASLIAGMRVAFSPHQPLSTMSLPGVATVNGLNRLRYEDLNLIAGSGAMICHFDYRTNSSRIRHAITTGDNEILAKREESMVSARHAALFQIVDSLAPYVGQINLGDDEQFGVLEEQLRSELSSIERSLQNQGFTPELGGLIRSLEIVRIAPSSIMLDELIIEGSLELGRPGNRITFSVLIL